MGGEIAAGHGEGCRNPIGDGDGCELHHDDGRQQAGCLREVDGAAPQAVGHLGIGGRIQRNAGELRLHAIAENPDQPDPYLVLGLAARNQELSLPGLDPQGQLYVQVAAFRQFLDRCPLPDTATPQAAFQAFQAASILAELYRNPALGVPMIDLAREATVLAGQYAPGAAQLLFRDPEQSGGGKAMWLIIIFVLPYIGVISYLAVHGKEMTLRSMEIDRRRAAVMRY